LFKKNYLFLFCLISLSPSVTAEESIGRFNIKEVKECKNKFGNTIAYSTCLDSVLSDKARKVKTWEKSINLKLQEAVSINGRRDAVVLFKKSSQSFKKFTEDNCKWQYLSLLPDINVAANMSKECHVFMTVQRIHELQQLNDFEFY
jgi:hypothetical protein